MPGGHPTHYKEKYCSLVKELGKEGHTIAMMASDIGVAKQTVYNWMGEHPKFLDAMKESVSSAQAYMEKIALDQMVDGKLNTVLWTKIMSCRFREDYTETIVNKNLDMTKKDAEDLQESQIERVAREVAQKLQEEY